MLRLCGILVVLHVLGTWAAPPSSREVFQCGGTGGSYTSFYNAYQQHGQMTRLQIWSGAVVEAVQVSEFIIHLIVFGAVSKSTNTAI